MVNIRRMTPDHSRIRARLFATLASVPDLETLPKSQKTALLALARKARFRWLDYVHQGKEPLTEWIMDCPPSDDWEDNRRDAQRQDAMKHVLTALHYRVRTGPQTSYWEALKVAHEKGRPLIRALLKTGTVDLREVRHLLGPMLLTRTDPAGRQHYIITELWANPTLEEEILQALIQFLRQPQCALRWCPVCDTVFAAGGHRRYCTRACTLRGVESNRKEFRRGYMREYMAHWRAQRKKSQIQSRKATAA
jgi:hypothetical protein